MPAKTKRDKMKTQMRKKAKLLQTTQSVPLNSTGKNFFAHDLKRSLLIIIILFAIEILLYFVSMGNYIFRILRMQ